MIHEINDYYTAFTEICKKPSDLKHIVNQHYVRLGLEFLKQFPNKVKSYHDSEHLLQVKKEIIDYCNSKYVRETNWWLKNDYKNLKWVIVFVAGTAISIVSLILTLRTK